MSETTRLDEHEHGNVKISDDVIGTIASIATSEINGVDGLSGGIAGDIAGIFGKKNLSKGVKVLIEEGQVTVDLNVIVDFGVKIPEVSWQIQESVKNSVETMTGLEIREINVHVIGVNIDGDKE